MELNERLTQIEARLQEIESRLGIEYDDADSDDNNSTGSSSGRTEPWISSSPSPSV